MKVILHDSEKEELRKKFSSFIKKGEYLRSEILNLDMSVKLVVIVCEFLKGGK